jgi:hypothetical protein
MLSQQGPEIVQAPEVNVALVGGCQEVPGLD